MNPYRKIFLLIASSALLACIFSCSYQVDRDPNVLVEKILSDPPTLNPTMAREISVFLVTNYMFDSLIQYDNRTWEPKPMLAEDWSVSPDHLTYTFSLRRRALWHDGHQLTADDVVFTFQAIADSRVDAAMVRSYLVSLLSVEKVDDYKVRFVFSQPYFKTLFMIGQVKIIPKHIFEDLDGFNTNPANRKPVGSGPFRFKSWKSGTKVELERNEDYYGDKPGLKGIVYQVIPSKETAFQLLKKQAIDKEDISSTQWAYQTEGKSFREIFSKYRYYPPNYTFIGWNLRKPFFDDRRVRQAMTILINRSGILDKVLFGQAEIVTGPFYKYGANYDDSLAPYPYDPVLAEKLLNSSGWIDSDGDGIRDRDGIPFRFTYLYRSGDRFGRSIGLFLEQELARVGIEVELMQLEWATMVGRVIRHDFDAVSLAYGLPVLEDAYSVWHSSGADEGLNYLGFKNSRADEILEDVRTEFDPLERASKYKELQRILHEEQPCTFLFMLPTLSAVSKRFENVVNYKTGFDLTEWKVGPWPMLKEW